MKIPITVREFGGAIRAVVALRYRIPRLRMRGQIQAIIDTGSPYILFSEAEGIRNQFPYKKMPKESSLGVSTVSSWRYPVNDVTLELLDTENNPHPYTSKIYFLKSTSSGVDQRIESTALPNIVGLDFIVSNKLGFWIMGDKGFLTDENITE